MVQCRNICRDLGAALEWLEIAGAEVQRLLQTPAEMTFDAVGWSLARCYCSPH